MGNVRFLPSTLISIFLIPLIFFSCKLISPDVFQNIDQDNPQNTGQVRIKGILTDFSPATRIYNGLEPKSISGITEIAAIPLLSPSIESYMLRNEQVFAINTDGSFDINLSTSSPWLLALKNGTATDPRDIYQGVIGIADQDDSLIYFPLDQVNSDIDLQSILQSSDEYISQTDMNTFASYFNCPLEAMQLMARFDNMGKYIKNYYTNCDLSAEAQYDMGVSYWYTSHDQLANGVYFVPDQFPRSRYLTWIAVSGITPFTMDQLTSGEKMLSLAPPIGSSAWDDNGDVEFTFENPIIATGTYNIYTLYGRIDYSFSGGLTASISDETGDVCSIFAVLGGEMPVGTWTLKEGENDLGWFDLTNVQDTDNNGHFVIIVPLPKFNFDGQGFLESVEIKLAYYDNELASYVELPDYRIVSSLIGRFSCTLRDYDINAQPSGFYEEWLSHDEIGSILADGRLSLTPTESSWKAGYDPAGQSRIIEEFGIGYRYGAADFSFVIRNNEPISCTITYEPNGATSGSVPTDTNAYPSGSTVIITGNVGNLVNNGYEFAGWNTSDDGSGAIYTEGDSFTITGNTILYAQWSPLPTYAVTYKPNGASTGSVPIDTNSYQGAASAMIMGNTGNLAKTGYDFAGWNTSATGCGTGYAAGDSVTITGNITLYAKWDPLPTYTVTYQPNGVTSGNVPVDFNQYLAGETATVLDNTGNMSIENYTFTGWNTSPDRNGTDYSAGALIMVTENVILYGCWAPVLSDGGLIIDFDNPAYPSVIIDGARTVAWGTTVTYTANFQYWVYIWYLDDSDAHPAMETNGEVLTINTQLLTPGVHTISVLAFDGSSNYFSGQFFFTVAS